MIRVKLRPVLMSLPEATGGDDFDIEVEDSLYELMQKAVQVLRQISRACSEEIELGNYAPVKWGAEQYATGYGSEQYQAELKAQSLLSGKPPPPVSQADPPIDTRVRDNDMRVRENEMSLDEFLEPPERTRSPPRPRANSWRHRP